MSAPTTGGYYFVREIASGGMGRVDLVLRREATFRRLSAVKRLQPHLREDTEIRAMFVEEARLAGLVHHPNVVGVNDVGEDERGPYLVMDYIAGVSVAKLLKTEREVPVTVVLEIVEQAARGLHAAHELRDHDGRFLDLVHRDVSPQNILVGYDGVARVADFGIAKALRRTSERTSTGILKGKLGYVSPEQLRFEPVDRRSDLFSLGIVLYELLAGARLYSNRDSRGPARILSEPPPDIGAVRAGLPPPLVELTYELLAKDRDDRPATAEEVAERLRVIREDFAALDEEALHLAPFMAARFETAAEEERRSIADANQRLDRGELESWPVATDPKAPVAPPSKRRWVPLAVALAALPVGVGIGAWAFGAARSEDAAAAETTQEARSADEGPRGDGSPAETDEPSAAGGTATEEPESPVEASAEEDDVVDAPAVVNREAPRRRPARRRRTGERAAREAPATSAMTSSPEPTPTMGALEPWTFDGMNQ